MQLTKYHLAAIGNFIFGISMALTPILIHTSILPNIDDLYQTIGYPLPVQTKLNLIFLILFLIASLNIYYGLRVFTHHTTTNYKKSIISCIISFFAFSILIALTNLAIVMPVYELGY